MGFRVLVTGGAGFIGSHIAEALIAAEHRVAVLDNLTTGRRDQVPAEALFFEQDLTESLDEVFQSFLPEVVVHQAAQVSVSISMRRKELDATVNILGSINLLETCRRHGVGKMLYASSSAAYGPLQTLPLKESMRPQPMSAYGASKYTVEHYLRVAGMEWGLEWAALRYSNVYGPRQDPHGEGGVVAIFSNKLLDGASPTIFGDGEFTRDYVFVNDVVRANVGLVGADLGNHPDPVFNVSTGVATSVNRLYEMLREALGVTIEATYGPRRPGDVEHSLLDNSKLRDFVGWQPETDFRSGMQKTVEHFAREARKK